MSNDREPCIGLDQPLQAGSALEFDKLGRKGFAQSAVASLRRVTSSAGFVLSIEGAWGSGKTSTLAMIDDLLLKEPKEKRPLVVHFNPWLVGDRDALLRQFLAKLASAVKLTDHAKEGKKVAKELKTYAKVFDVVKLIPGAEPWASIVKSVVESVGEATGSIGDYKTPDIEQQKGKVEEALRRFARPIIVFVDDIDRLFPLEVYEIVRIIKAVGDLPNVGYVLAWDPLYVSRALESASVPQSETYLDKIVQVRMPLPGLSSSARELLINEALRALPSMALESHFPGDEDRLSGLYFSGLRELLEQPRDVTRVFNTVNVIEPALRGEVVFADIVGLAALIVKAPAVFDLLRQNPRWFVGRLPNEDGLTHKNQDVLKEGTAHLDAAYSKCSRPEATRQIVHRLFPMAAKAEDEFTFGQIEDVKGHIAAPSRLLVALQLSVSSSDVSLVNARRYLFHPELREDIALTLTPQNCLEFIENLGDVAESLEGSGISDLAGLCISIARLADTPTFATRSKDRSGFFSLPAENVAMRAIDLLVNAVDRSQGPAIAASIVQDEQALSVATRLLVISYLVEKSERDILLVCEPEDKSRLLQKFAENALIAAKSNALLRTCDPHFVLWNLATLAKDECPKIFVALQSTDATLDSFALELLSSSFDSHKGQRYAIPKDRSVLEAYCSFDKFRAHAQNRLADATLGLPAKAAWQSVVEEKSFYGKDGSPTRG